MFLLEEGKLNVEEMVDVDERGRAFKRPRNAMCRYIDHVIHGLNRQQISATFRDNR